MIPLAQTVIVAALPGQTVVIRYPRLPEMSDRELAAAIEKEAGQNIPYELSEVFLDWTPLDKVTEAGRTMIKVLLVAARYEIIDARMQIAQEAEIAYGILGVDSLALADAAECCDFLRVGESVALVNLGAQTTSIHFIKDGKSNFIRDVSWGARELMLAISKARRIETPEAEQILIQSSAPQAPAPPPLPALEEEPPPPPPKPPQPIKSALDPLDDELGGLDDIAPPSKPKAATPGGVPEKSITEILNAPFARLVSEVRRSFDYYEQQLYEHPVERLIVSGGIAHLPLLRETLAEELGVVVELADPSHSAIELGPGLNVGDLQNQPAQFMVAVGLAARGMADL